MLSGHLQGRILSFLSSAIKPKYILEIGTYTGYSALCMAEGLSKNGKLITIDKNIELETIKKKYINDSYYKNQIEFINANAIEDSNGNGMGFVFIDADKKIH